MKKSILIALALACFVPGLQAEMKKTEAPETKATTDKKPRNPAATAESRMAAAGKQAESLSAEQTTKLLELVNKGDSKAIGEVKGIGPKLAGSIIAKRPYSKVEELVKVDGIGESKFNDILAFAKGQQPAATAKKETPKKME